MREPPELLVLSELQPFNHHTTTTTTDTDVRWQALRRMVIQPTALDRIFCAERMLNQGFQQLLLYTSKQSQVSCAQCRKEGLLNSTKDSYTRPLGFERSIRHFDKFGLSPL